TASWQHFLSGGRNPGTTPADSLRPRPGHGQIPGHDGGWPAESCLEVTPWETVQLVGRPWGIAARGRRAAAGHTKGFPMRRCLCWLAVLGVAAAARGASAYPPCGSPPPPYGYPVGPIYYPRPVVYVPVYEVPLAPPKVYVTPAKPTPPPTP